MNTIFGNNKLTYNIQWHVQRKYGFNTSKFEFHTLILTFLHNTYFFQYFSIFITFKILFVTFVIIRWCLFVNVNIVFKVYYLTPKMCLSQMICHSIFRFTQVIVLNYSRLFFNNTIWEKHLFLILWNVWCRNSKIVKTQTSKQII